MMALKGELEVLLHSRGSLCCSVYLPISPGDPRQNVSRIHNLCRTAGKSVAALTCQAEAEELLKPLELSLEREVRALPHGSHGLAGFSGAGFQRVVALPFEVAEWSAAGRHFYVRPLLSLFHDTERFYILALSQKQVRLFEAGRFDISEIHVAEIPKEIPDFTRELQFHLTAAGSGHGPVMYPGGRDEPKDRLTAYLREVHRAIHALLRSHTLPLVLASVNYVASLYRSVSVDLNLLARSVEGNPDLLSMAELRAKALESVESYWECCRKREIAKYPELAGTGITSSALEEILASAGNGRIRTLFLESGSRQPDGSGEDQLNAAAVGTLRSGGLVYEIDRAAMPAPSPIAALYRY